MGDKVLRFWRFGIMQSTLTQFKRVPAKHWNFKTNWGSRGDSHGTWKPIRKTALLWLAEPYAK